MPNAKRKRALRLIAATCLTVVFGSAIAQSKNEDSNGKDPYLKPDETWISISGTAVEAQAELFTLDYGEGLITVEMDDWNWYREGGQVLEGNNVTVYGEIDDDLYKTRTIEASSIYVENLGTYFYASSADEEYDNGTDYWMVTDPIDVGQTVIRGTVSSVDDRGFTVGTDTQKVTVDTSTMSYNPLDKKGYQTVNKGDYVNVSGDMEDGFWEKRELMADTLVVLEED